MDLLIFSTFGLSNYSTITKTFLNYNPNLLNNNEFVHDTFVKACVCSNHGLVKYFIKNNDVYTRLTNTINFNSLFEQLCQTSNLQNIQWFYNEFSYLVNLSNINCVEKSIRNPDNNVIIWLIENNSQIYSMSVYEFIFVKALENLDLIIMKYIYTIKPTINIKIIHNVMLKNSLNVNLINAIIEWLETIAKTNGYKLKYSSKHTIILSDLIHIKSNEEFQNFAFGIDSNFLSSILLDKNLDKYDLECVLCMDMPNEIISNCFHKFCKKCIRQWIIKNNFSKSCPTCRKSNFVEFYHIE
jgi:hypothetical protein